VYESCQTKMVWLPSRPGVGLVAGQPFGKTVPVNYIMISYQVPESYGGG